MNHTDYYIYLHTDINGIPFYVGKGRARRAYKKSGRTKKWTERSKDGYTISFLHQSLTEDDAYAMEDKYINYPPEGWELLNHQKNSKPVKIDKVFIETYVYYDPSSPTALRWKTDKFGVKGQLVYSKGDIAGSLGDNTKGRYGSIMVEGKVMKLHRVIYTLEIGDIPDGYVINHKDNNIVNNTVENLEVCTQLHNMRRTKWNNGSTLLRNKSGVNGVNRMLNRKGGKEYWIARWRHKDREFSKSFPIDDHGETEAFRLACEYRKQMIEKLNSEGAGYSIAE